MILDEIVAHKKTEVEALKKSGKAARWMKNIRKLPPLRDFRAALAAPGFHVIAEIKRASPSSGGIRPDLDPGALAALYTKGGASAISVLTDKKYFSGHISDLQVVRDATALPLLRKDFTLDADQIVEARVGGADTVLLIVAILSAEKLTELINFVRSLGMEPLVEVHNEAEMTTALHSSARIIGINNRDLQSFTVDIATTEKIMAKL
jgi:indole-3-glycerol phosphate synthase